MAFFKWRGATKGPTADYAGWQDSNPMLQTVSNSRHYVPENSLQISTVYACVDLLARTIACLPCDVFLINSDGSKSRDTNCNLDYILSKSPNYGMTPYEFISTLVMHWALRGNAYGLITRGKDKLTGIDKVKSIYPLNPDQMSVYMDDNGKITYRYYNKKNSYVDYKPESILHWKALGNGILGLSKLEYMKASVTESALAQETAIDIFTNKGKMKGILTSEKIISKTQKAEIQKQFNAMRDDGIPVLPADLKFQQLSLSPAETQLLQTRQYSVEEICRWFGVPSALINSDGGAPGSNLEQVTANFYKSTILPMIISLQQAIIKRVPCDNEKYDHVVEFRLSYLNRSNDTARSAINAQALQNGWKSRNEVRIDEGLAPVADGDMLTAQSNLVPLSKLGQNPSKEETILQTQPQRQ